MTITLVLLSFLMGAVIWWLFKQSINVQPWVARGTWTVVASPPGNVSVTPASGSGLSQTFAFVFSDPYGYTDLNWVDILINNQIAAPGSCFLQYFRATNTLMLVSDAA